MTVMFWIAIATLLLYALAALDLFIGNRTVSALCDVAPLPGSSLVTASSGFHPQG